MFFHCNNSHVRLLVRMDAMRCGCGVLEEGGMDVGDGLTALGGLDGVTIGLG